VNGKPKVLRYTLPLVRPGKFPGERLTLLVHHLGRFEMEWNVSRWKWIPLP
jgi:hypothetical protein